MWDSPVVVGMYFLAAIVVVVLVRVFTRPSEKADGNKDQKRTSGQEVALMPPRVVTLVEVNRLLDLPLGDWRRPFITYRMIQILTSQGKEGDAYQREVLLERWRNKLTEWFSLQLHRRFEKLEATSTLEEYVEEFKSAHALLERYGSHLEKLAADTLRLSLQEEAARRIHEELARVVWVRPHLRHLDDDLELEKMVKGMTLVLTLYAIIRFPLGLFRHNDDVELQGEIERAIKLLHQRPAELQSVPTGRYSKEKEGR